MEKPANGALCHAEIPVEDAGRAKTFYSEVFGWTFQEIPEMEYTIFQSGKGGIGGGFAKRGEQTPQYPVNYVQCDDIDATLKRIADHGGKVVTPKMEVGAAGWLAHAHDTEGNLLGLWQGKGGQ